MHQNNTISSTGDVSVISSRLEKKEMTAINLKKEEEGKSRKIIIRNTGSHPRGYRKPSRISPKG